ncbi:MAG: LicD family protein [Fibrobacter sp.]|nr:LicD family protein [Fibrobacter sp.]
MRELTNDELHDFSLGILKEVHQFCERENIRYSLAYGTLIGAVRHQGFIPWDNDIDICMPRPDYERFIKTFKSEKFQLAFFGEGCKYDSLIAYARVFDNRETIAKNGHWIAQPAGVWIDVFPLDGVPDDPQEFAALYKELHQEWERIIPKKIQFKRISHCKGLKNKLKLLRNKWRQKNGLGGHRMQKEYNEKIRRIPFETANYWSQLAVMDNGPVEHIPVSAFDERRLLKFEDAQFYVMKDYDLNLRAVYGDYMQLPPEDQREPHQSFIKFYWKNR